MIIASGCSFCNEWWAKNIIKGRNK